MLPLPPTMLLERLCSEVVFEGSLAESPLSISFSRLNCDASIHAPHFGHGPLTAWVVSCKTNAVLHTEQTKRSCAPDWGVTGGGIHLAKLSQFQAGDKVKHPRGYSHTALI
jgi:hypothetical protein